MQKVQRDVLRMLALQVVVLVLVGSAVDLSLAGWLAGLTFAIIAAGLVARALSAASRPRLGPADWVTASRLALVGAITGLVVDSWLGAISTSDLVSLSVVAIILDGVDGRVARATSTTSEFGARFDMETDAVLILVLSGYVAPLVGWWVLAIGAARYAFALAGRFLPWLTGPVPFRYWRKVVAVVQAVTLVAVASGLFPPNASRVALLGALALLIESFGRDAVWLWRQHRIQRGAPAMSDG